MRADITATDVEIRLHMTQRELELLHAVLSKLTGFKAEEIAGVAGSAKEYTEIVHGLSDVTRQQIRRVETSGELERLFPRATEVSHSPV